MAKMEEVRSESVKLKMFLILCSLFYLPFCLIAQDKSVQEKPAQEQQVEKLLKQLNDDEWKVRAEATGKLIELWEDDAVKKRVEEALKKAQEAVKAQGLSGNEMTERCEQILKGIDFRRTLGKELVKALGAEKVEVLLQADGETLLKHFMEWLKDVESQKKYGMEEKRQEVLSSWIVDHLGDSETDQHKLDFLDFVYKRSLKGCTVAVAMLLKDGSYLVRCDATVILGLFGEKKYIKEISLLLQDETSRVRRYAAITLGLLGAKEYSKDIARLLEDRTWGNERFVHIQAGSAVRGAAVWALGKLGMKEYAKDIAKLLSDSGECYVPGHDDEKEDRRTRVSAVAVQVLKEWGYKLTKMENGTWKMEEEIKEQK